MNYKCIFFAGTMSALLMPGLHAAATITADELSYGISASGSNSYQIDLTGDPFWGAGSQRSANGSVDSTNRRSGRVFVEFVLTQSLIDEANLPGATVSLGYLVDSIGAGVAGTPYTDGLDLRYLGISATNLTVSSLWGTASVGGDQSDILATNGTTGSHSLDAQNLNILSGIQGATAGQRIAFGFVNSAGTISSNPVGNSNAETYSFGMNHVIGNYSLSVVPEPSVALLGGISLLGLLHRRRK